MFLKISRTRDLPPKCRLLDIGCGKGIQTNELTSILDSLITAVDNHPFFLEYLANEAKKSGLEDRISCIDADMKQLSFASNSFDVIWSEGAIFVMGISDLLNK